MPVQRARLQQAAAAAAQVAARGGYGRRLPMPGPLKSMVNCLQVIGASMEGINFPLLSHSPTIPQPQAIRSPTTINFPKVSASPTRKSPTSGSASQLAAVNLDTIAIEEEEMDMVDMVDMEEMDEITLAQLEDEATLQGQLLGHHRQDIGGEGQLIRMDSSYSIAPPGHGQQHQTMISDAYGQGDYVTGNPVLGYNQMDGTNMGSGIHGGIQEIFGQPEYYQDVLIVPPLNYDVATLARSGLAVGGAAVMPVPQPPARILPSPLSNGYSAARRRAASAANQLIIPEPLQPLPSISRPSSRGLMGPRFVAGSGSCGVTVSGGNNNNQITVSGGHKSMPTLAMDADDDDDWC